MKKITLLIAWLFAISLWSPDFGDAADKPKGNPPIITASFAVEQGYYGYVWKIYLEAEDPDGDMSRIAVQVDQLGYGHYPTDWVMIKGPFQKQLRGYLQWNTFSPRAPFLREWTHITATVSILDKAGNWSKEVVFPFEFVSGGIKKVNPPPPFDREGLPRLGYIHIELVEPTMGAADSRRED